MLSTETFFDELQKIASSEVFSTKLSFDVSQKQVRKEGLRTARNVGLIAAGTVALPWIIHKIQQKAEARRTQIPWESVKEP